VIYRDTLGDIHALDLATGEAFRKPTDPANEALLTAECTDDGARIAFLRQDFRSVTREIVIEGEGAPAEPVQVPAQAQGITWSPDGTKIAYIDFAIGEGYRLATIDTVTGEEMELVRGANFGGSPRWSPDGRFIAYHAQVGLQTQLMMYEIGSGADGPTQLTNGDLGAFDPEWTADSKHLYFATAMDAADVLQIFELDIDSGDTSQITDSDVYKRFPRLSPEGSLIGFTGSIIVPQVSAGLDAAALHSFGIFLVDADGSDERALTADPRLNPGPQDPYLDAFLLTWCGRGPWLEDGWTEVEPPV
jgi:dipeptidyl aminopeptidase/acylaminoacyl peptidase